MIGLSAVGRLGLQSLRPAGDLYPSLERAGLIAARSVDAGIWYPAADLSNCWQDAAGTTPCTAEGQPVGLLLDQQYRAAGPELVVNGGFDTDTAWDKIAGATISGGLATIAGNPGFANAFVQNTGPTPEVGKTYVVTYTVVSVAFAGSGVSIRFGGALTAIRQTTGTFTETVTATATSRAWIARRGSANWEGSIDNLSVREVLAAPNAGIAGPELVTNGTFATVAIGGPAFTNYNTGAIRQAGRTYRVRFSVEGYTGSNTIGIAGATTFWETSPVSFSGNGTYEQVIKAITSGVVELFSNSCTFSNISVRELPGYHATQPTAGNRPTLVRLANGRWGLNFTGGLSLTVPTPAPSGTGFVGVAARQGNIPADGNNRILISIRDGSYSANYRNPQLRLTGGPAGLARITIMWRGGGVTGGETATANEIALEPFLTSSVQDAGLSRLWRNGALAASIASTAAGDGGDNPPSYLGWSALGGWQGTIGTAWSSRNAPTDPTRIAIERFAAQHTGSTYST
jgi:hypothetical protein